MMEERLKWAKRLNELLEINFRIAKTYRRAVEAVTDATLKSYLLNQASGRSVFARELIKEIEELGGRASSYSGDSPRHISFRSSPLKVLSRNSTLLIQNCIKRDKKCIKKYRKALSRINEGSSREKILRHISSLEKNIKELKGFKLVIKSNDKPRDQLISETN